MTFELVLPTGESLTLQAVQVRKYRGARLPGAEISSSAIGDVIVQEFETDKYSINYNFFQFLRRFRLRSKHKPGIRLQTVVEGNLYAKTNTGGKLHLKTGQYNLLDETEMDLDFRKGKDNSYFIVHYSTGFLDQLGLEKKLFENLIKPRWMSKEMTGVVQEILHNPYEPSLRRFFYENKVRELLFLVLAEKGRTFPGNMSDMEIAAIYAADAAIISELEHILIADLGKKVELSEFKLKKGFREIFGMAIFERLIHHRMQRARKLLIETNKGEKEIASLTGYKRLTSFINAFKKRFGVSPKIYRKMSRDKNE